MDSEESSPEGKGGMISQKSIETQGMSKLDPTSSYSVGESLQSEAERGRGLRWDMASVVTGELRNVNGVRQQRCVVL